MYMYICMYTVWCNVVFTCVIHYVLTDARAQTAALQKLQLNGLNTGGTHKKANKSRSKSPNRSTNSSPVSPAAEHSQFITAWSSSKHPPPPSNEELNISSQTRLPSPGLYGLVLNDDPPILPAEYLAGLQLSSHNDTHSAGTPAQNSEPEYEAAIPVTITSGSSLESTSNNTDGRSRPRLDSLNRGGASPGSSLPDVSIDSDEFLHQKVNLGYINARELKDDTTPNASLHKRGTRNPVPAPRDSHV